MATLPVAYAAPSTLRVAPSPHPPLASLGRVPGPVAPSLLATLLRRLDGIESLRWIRLMYLFPDRSLEPLIDVLAESSRICRYLDIPFQHASPEIVRAMNRPGGAEMYLDFIARVREAVPDVSLRSTFIVGFPGETERHFEELLAFVRAAQLDWVGVFQYSREEGAPAATLRARVPRRVAQERYDRLMQLQQEITATRNQRWLGRTLDVLVEEVSETEAIGRHEGQAPEIDGVVRIELSGLPATDRPVPGQWIPARVTDIDHYDLIAKSQ